VILVQAVLIKYLLKDKGDYDIVEGFISSLISSCGYKPIKIKALLESASNKESKELKSQEKTISIFSNYYDEDLTYKNLDIFDINNDQSDNRSLFNFSPNSITITSTSDFNSSISKNIETSTSDFNRNPGSTSEFNKKETSNKNVRYDEPIKFLKTLITNKIKNSFKNHKNKNMMTLQFSLFRQSRGLFLAAVVIFACALAHGRDAIVRTVKGSPRYIVGGIPTPLVAGDRLPAGALVQTGEKDSVDLIIGVKEKLISVGPNSELRVKENERVLVLEKGELVGSVRGSKSNADSEPLTIRSPMGTTRVGVGDFSVSTIDNSLNVLSGKNVTHEPVLRASDSRAGQAAMRIADGMSMSFGAGGGAVRPLGSSANDALMTKVGALVTTDSTGGPTVRAALSVVCTSPEPYPNPGTGTPGYWKTHPEAWPVSSIVIGGKTYTVTQAISLMNLTSTKKDRTYTMFQDMVCARLNTIIGNDPTCISSMIAAGDAWMAAHPVGSRVGGSSTAWVQGDPIHQQLDAYNNGLLCAPHRT